jgi:hypothetical protein
MLDARGQLLRAAVGFAACSMPSYDRALWALCSWLDSWSGIGHVAVGMPRQGYDPQLTRYDDRGWRATFYTTGMEALADERDRHRVGTHAVARGPGRGAGCAEGHREAGVTSGRRPDQEPGLRVCRSSFQSSKQSAWSRIGVTSCGAEPDDACLVTIIIKLRLVTT